MALYVEALLIKFFIALAVTGVLLLVVDISLTGGLIIAMTLTLVTFLAADLPFLLVLGRKWTVVIDTILAVPLFWGMTYLYTGIHPGTATLLLLALIVAVGEWFFHIYATRIGFCRETGP